MPSLYILQIFMAWICGNKKNIQFWLENFLENATLEDRERDENV
jgi:hypothetical protein